MNTNKSAHTRQMFQGANLNSGYNFKEIRYKIIIIHRNASAQSHYAFQATGAYTVATEVWFDFKFDISVIVETASSLQEQNLKKNQLNPRAICKVNAKKFP